MGKSTLNVGLSILCTEAERAAVVLRHHPHAGPALARFGLPADPAARLDALALRGHEAYTEVGTHRAGSGAARPRGSRGSRARRRDSGGRGPGAGGLPRT